MIEEAVQRCLPVTLTNRHDNVWEVYKANFLALNTNRLAISQPVSDCGLGHLEAARGQEVAITFKKGYNKCLFMARVIGQEHFELDTGINVPAVVVYCPEQIEKIQRRAYNRISPPQDMQVSIDFWPCDGDANKDRRSAMLVDLSAGGLGMTALAKECDLLEENKLYQLEFVPLQGQGPLVVQCRVRHINSDQVSEVKSVGVQFIGLEMTEQGRATLRRLGRVVSVYQRHQPLSQHANLSLGRE